MDMRSGESCAPAVLATGDKALQVNSAGKGPVSAEWMIPKALWLKRNEPDVYAAAKYICEYQDCMNYWLTGEMVASVTNVTIRWHYSATHGWPVSLLESLDMSDLLEKWPQKIVKLGETVGGLTQSAADYLGLPVGMTVAQGGADAFIGIIGLGVVNAGVWGAYEDAVLPGAFVFVGTVAAIKCIMVEGGQTSTGSIINWFKRTLCTSTTDDNSSTVTYKQLDQEASDIPIGCEGLLCLDHFQGNRTPHTDSLSRGAFIGLTLRHTRGHMFRALMEAVCMGTEVVLQAMRESGYTPTAIAIAGGATRSKLWLQMHCDVTGLPLRVTSSDACLLGAAVLASVGAGAHESIKQAVTAMVKVERTILPNMAAHAEYKKVLVNYNKLYKALKPIYHGTAVEAEAVQPNSKHIAGKSNSRSGAGGSGGITMSDALQHTTTSALADSEETIVRSTTVAATERQVQPLIGASILAADMCNIGQEVDDAITAGADWCHVDIVDNSFAP
eukprot:7180-Heterococcus_DN1.PRE.1